MPPPSLANITVIWVTYNSAHCIAQQAIALQSLPHLIVVDNASADDVAAELDRHLPQAQLIRMPRNLGFGAANNAALRKVRTSFALLLNPDCFIETADIDLLYAAAQDYPEHAIVAPQVWSGSQRKELSYRFPAGYWRQETSGKKTAHEVSGVASFGFVTGAAMLLRLSLFEKIGFFDEDFFLYYEDEDLCLRCFNAGQAPLVLPQAKAVHHSRSSVKEGFPYRSQYIRGYHHAQSKIIFTAKHNSTSHAQRLRWTTLALACLALPLRLLWPDLRYVVRLWGRIRGLVAYSPAQSSRSPLS